ncbi:LacI family DNA-binding transcriptional regulator [Roseovarius sp. A21]|uniref:LacI family DNA-binding transcriptional regulator n=1 Tax=Roseovarius bejariae TaxID=2576383 RepID=A0A844CJM4_9RHOB|nr:LacI family DNA-binding transcriptional regulator [Roseovarius bejariae]MRU14872.1 LacI family DNA-binding transcriptional regulator [Roseovarius bejariae]
MTKNPDPASKPLPTLADVASRAGVSTATVSRCLNAPAQVVEETRKRVLQAVQDLGYSPNFGARALAAKRTNTVGAVIPTMDNAIFARGLQAFQEELGRNGITMLVASSAYRPELEAEQIRALVARGADALLLIGHDRDPAIYRFLEARGVPALIAWAYDETAGKPSIGFDNRRAMAGLAAQVIAQGHTRLAAISAEQACNDRARERMNGVREAMQAAGLPPEGLHLIEVPYSVDHGAEAMGQLMALSPRPTAVICGNDVLAVGAMQKAQEMGLDVPRDVSVTGFDDIELARVVTPQLTTVHVPHRDMGRQAAQLLKQMIGGTPMAQSVALQTELRLRGTLGPPPG